MANSLASKVSELSGDARARSFFLNIKGPELLNKYVGETERQIRLVFQRAREKSEQGWPVIVFFDEMESLFRTRGSGISSDIESTIVPQLLAEIDGVEALRNVIVIGASNREDLIDPAILRPGRLDVKIKIERPDAEAAASIFARYLTPSLPIAAEMVDTVGGGDPDKAVRGMIEQATEDMYRPADANRFLEVTYQNGDKEVMYYRDFASGAMIENVVRRAKKLAIKREIAGGTRGIMTNDLLASVRQEFKEHEDLPNTTTPTTGPGSRARRASASCSCAPSCRRRGGHGLGRSLHRASADRPVLVGAGRPNMRGAQIAARLAVLIAMALASAACGRGNGFSGEAAVTIPPTGATADQAAAVFVPEQARDGAATDAVAPTQGGDLLQTVQERGRLVCGVSGTRVVFSETRPDGSVVGIDADYCRVVAAAVLGDASAVEFVPLTTGERFAALQTGTIDVLIRSTTWTQSRDVGLGLDFGPTIYYDGQQLMARAADGYAPSSRVADIAGAVVCALAGTTTEKNVTDAAEVAGVDITLNTFEDFDIITDNFIRGACDLVTADGSALAGRKAKQQPDDQEWVIFPATPISKEPLAPVYPQNQSRFGDARELGGLRHDHRGREGDRLGQRCRDGGQPARRRGAPACSAARASCRPPWAWLPTPSMRRSPRWATTARSSPAISARRA